MVPERNILIIGYGNVDRQDDGAAWHVLYRLAERLQLPLPDSLDEGFPPPDTALTTTPGAPPDLLYVLQISPELSETLAHYARACFVDAHTENNPQEISVIPLHPGFQTSPLTHHMTPETCLGIAQSMYGAAPGSILVSIRGYEFGFSQGLSERTSSLADKAVEEIIQWVEEKGSWQSAVGSS